MTTSAEGRRRQARPTAAGRSPARAGSTRSVPRSPWRPIIMRRQWLSPNSSFQNAQPWRMIIAWCQGTATTTTTRADTAIAGQELRAPQPLPVPGEEQVGDEDDDGQPSPARPLASTATPAHHGRDVEIERRAVAGAAAEPEEGERPDVVRNHRDRAVHEELAAADRDLHLELDRIDDQLRHHQQQQHRDRGEEGRVVRVAPEPLAPPGQKLVRSSSSAMAPSASAMVMGPTKAMSVIAWRATRKNIGLVAITSAARKPARRETKRATTMYTAHIAEHADQAERHAHRPFGAREQRHLARGIAGQPDARDVHADAHQPEGQHRLGPEHVRVARRARPPQADEVAALGHLARDLGVVRLPRIPQAVGPGERDVEQQAHGDDQQGHLALAQAVEEARRRGRGRRIRGRVIGGRHGRPFEETPSVLTTGRPVGCAAPMP